MLAKAQNYEEILHVLSTVRLTVIENIQRNDMDAHLKMDQLELIDECEEAMSRNSHEEMASAFKRRRLNDQETEDHSTTQCLYYFQVQPYIRPELAVSMAAGYRAPRRVQSC